MRRYSEHDIEEAAAEVVAIVIHCERHMGAVAAGPVRSHLAADLARLHAEALALSRRVTALQTLRLPLDDLAVAN